VLEPAPVSTMGQDVSASLTRFYISDVQYSTTPQQSATNRILDILAHAPATWQTCGMETYTVGQAAKLAGIGPSTARDYLRAHPSFFSEDATPAAGTRRVLLWPDIETLATIRNLKRQGRGDDEIAATLATGERDNIRPHADDTTAAGSQLVVRLSAAAAQWEATASQLADERDHLRDELEAERAARLAAEIRAAVAETKLDAMPPAAPEAKPGFWQRLFGG